MDPLLPIGQAFAPRDYSNLVSNIEGWRVVAVERGRFSDACPVCPDVSLPVVVLQHDEHEGYQAVYVCFGCGTAWNTNYADGMPNVEHEPVQPTSMVERAKQAGRGGRSTSS